MRTMTGRRADLQPAAGRSKIPKATSTACSRILLATLAHAVMLALVLAGMSFAGEKLLSGLRMEQAISREESGYSCKGGVKITFALAKAAEVTITIARHNSLIIDGDPSSFAGIDTPVLPEPFVVRTIKLGKLQAGKQEVTWDGLDDKGHVITEPLPGFLNTPDNPNATWKEYSEWRAKDPAKANQAPTEQELIRHDPADLFRIKISAGDEQLTGNFHRQRGTVPCWRKTKGRILDGLQLPDGDFVVMDYDAWFGFRLGPDLRQKGRYPKIEAAWNANKPVQSKILRVDSKGNVYIRTRNAIYKYLPDGTDGTWEEKADHIAGMALCKRLDEGTPEAAEKVKKPGFAYEWSGFDVGPDDNLYWVRTLPEPMEIQVFAPSGKYLRSIPLPKNPFASQYTAESIRFGKDGAMWVGIGEFYRVDPQTGAVGKKLPQYVDTLAACTDGHLIGFQHGVVARFTAEGDFAPFTADSPYLIREGEYKGWLDFKRPDGVSREADPSRGKEGPMAILPGNANDFYVICQDSRWISPGERPAIHFTSDGKVIEQQIGVSMCQERPGNVFVGGEPAQINIYPTNLTEKPLPFTAQWTLTDFDGKRTQGKASFTVPPRTHITVPLPLDMPGLGHYRLEGKVLQGETVMLEINTSAARIRPRKIEVSPDSPFAIVWGPNYYLSGIVGAKKERVGVMPPAVMLGPGVARPDLPEVRSMRRGGMTGAVRESARWGVRQPIMFCYGEPWFTSSWMAHIYSYDGWLKDFPIRMMDQFAGPDIQHLQFWNEPDVFQYHDDGKFNREHYALLTKLVWSICKARGKETRSIPDGDAANTTMVEKTLPAFGGEPYIDAVPCHYPGAQGVTWDKMTLPDLPEGKVESVKQLLAIRDKFYPGRPLLNTEEGWWGHRDIKPDEAAAVIARVFIPQIAAGVDELYWFAQMAVDDPTYLLGAENAPWPSYCAYATMTRMLEGAEFLGNVDLGVPGTFAYLFGRGDEAIVPLWAAQGEPEVTIKCGAAKATVTDMMDRERDLKPVAGAITLKLSPHTQYLRLAQDAWAEGIAKAEAKRRLDALKLDSPAAIPAAIGETTKTALSDNAAMARLFYVVQAAKQAALAGEAPAAKEDTAALAAAVHKAILAREGQDGYLRQARVAMGWTDRLARTTAHQGKVLAPGMAWATKLSADAAQALARAETPCYPGCVINAFIGNTGEIAKVRAIKPVVNNFTETRIDAQFRFQIDAKPGEAFELELTVWDFYKHPINGTVAPRLPDGWKAAPAKADYRVQPGDFQRFTFAVTIPADAKPGIHLVGGLTAYEDQPITEIHTQRVNVIQ